MAVIIEQMKYAVDEDGIMCLPQSLGLEVGCEYILTENIQGKEYISTAIAQLYEEEGTEIGVTLLFEQAAYFPRYILSVNPELVEMLGAGALIQIVSQSAAFTDYNKFTFSLHKAETEDDTDTDFSIAKLIFLYNTLGIEGAYQYWKQMKGDS